MYRLSVLLFSLTILSQLVFAGRYYDARTGRFLQIDPKAQKYPAWSPYNYAIDNPLLNIDPDGKEVKNSQRQVLSNPSVVNRLLALDAKLSVNLHKSSTNFVIEISGGDRYVENGKVYSQTDNGEIPQAKTSTRHVQDNGALAVDISLRSTVKESDMITAAKEVGFTEIIPSEKYPKNPHLHIALPASYKESYDNDNTIDYYAKPDFTPQPLPVKNVGDVIQELVKKHEN